MTFELRFEAPMVAVGQVGVSTTNSPLVITPPLAGSYTWLSPNSGVFTPAEPLALDARYTFTLAPGVQRADGQPAGATLRRTLTTPPFGLVACSPSEANMNASSDPEIKLAFNANVGAREAATFMSFRDANGRRIPADVRQGTWDDMVYELGGYSSLLTWSQQYAIAKSSEHSGPENEAEEKPSKEFANILIATPRQPLPLGTGWRLVVAPGTPSLVGTLHLRDAAEVPVGNVTPFVVTEVAANHQIGSGPSIRIFFSKQVPESVTNGITGWMELNPCPTNLTVGTGGASVVLQGDFKGQTCYTLKLSPDFQASEPFKLSGSNTFTLKMPRIEPRLYFPAFARDQLAGGKRSFPLLAVNVPKVRVRAKLMDPQTVIHALRGYGSYFARWDEHRESDSWDEPYRPLNYNLVPGRTVFSEQLDLEAEPDIADRLELGWDLLLAGRKTGVVFLDAERVGGESKPNPALGTQALIQLTDLGLVWKTASAGVDVFVFSHSTGRPLPGATARLFSNENEPLQEVLTDANGLAHLQANTNADWIAVQLGDDFHATLLAENRVWLHRFNLPFAVSDEDEFARRVMLFSDRNVYRPGEALHLAALVRDWNGQNLKVPDGLTGTLDCVDARGRPFFQTNAAFSLSGSWSALVPLPASSRGTYLARLHLGNKEYVHPFQVEDFQPNAFEINLSPKASFSAGEPIEVPVSARYLFGKALSSARVEWSLDAQDTEFKPERFGGFTFQAADPEYRHGRNRSTVTLSGQGMLGGLTNFIIAADLPVNAAAPQPRMTSLLVEVTDINQQTLSRRVEFVRHSSDFYLGLRLGADVLSAGKAPQLEAAALRTDGQPWPEPVKAQINLRRIDWQPVRIQGAGRTIRYRNEAVLTNIYQAEIEVPPIQIPAGPETEIKGVPLPGLPALPGGHYLVEVSAKDPSGRSVVSSLGFDVSAPEEIGSDYHNDVILKLKTDRKQYAPGEAAAILVEAPFTGTALVTVEREKVLRSFTTRLEGNAPSLRVPLQAGDVPNVFVSVVLLRGADECPRKVKEPEYRIGYCELAVAEIQNRLAVTVTPAATNYLPAQTVEVTAHVADPSGGVSGAGVVLYAVDDGILHLTDYSLPDPYAFFNATRPLGVQSGVSLPNLLTEDPEALTFHNKGYLGGGGGEERVRKNFLACAFWNASLTTDAQGNAHARFPAPDSLTRYRIFAVAHTINSRFGSGQSVFQVSKPLIIEPALPAFANITDRLVARSLIQNQTANAGEVLATLELDDKTKADAAGRILSRRVSVPANGSAVVEFPVELVETGNAKWIWKARFVDPAAGDYTDAVQSTLEVGHVVPMLREVLLGHTSGSQTNLLSSANPQLLAGRGSITVNIANTRLNDLGETIEQLLHYPYGCAEQTGSSLLPWIVLRDMPGMQPLLHSGTNDVEGAIRTGVARLISMQTRTGGLGYWPQAREPMLWASAYGGMILALAQRHNVAVPADEFTSLLKYLSQQLRSARSDSAELSDLCLGLYALALAGQAEPAYHEKIYSLRQKLTGEDRALLALAIAESKGPAAMIGELLHPDPAPQPAAADGFGCPARAQAIRLLAWTRYRPDDTTIDRLVDDLMREQKQGHWNTTQGNAWALLALTDYAQEIEGKAPPAEGQLICGAETIPFRLDEQTRLFTRILPMTNISKASLKLMNASTNRLYTSVMIEARPSETQLPRQDRGFGLQRRYERLDDDNQPRDLTGLRVGDRVLVTLNLAVHEEALYVAVDDALPSIFEAVNPEFKTQETRSAASVPNKNGRWLNSFREIRKDRCLYFADRVVPGNYTLRYVARVRAAGNVTAPPAKVEEMYHPERCGLSGTQTLSSQGME